jgi:exoribonuclease R
MSSRVVRVRAADDGVAAESLRKGIAQIQAEMKVSAEFPASVEEAAAKATASPRLPDPDRTDIAFVTIDPASALDLDQALHIERAGDGFVVHYAIADLAAFITPGDPVDIEANRRGETLYGADSKIPLHPKSISEDAGSLLADQVRPALLWTITLDATGEGTDVNVERALVKSRAKLSYDEVQAAIDDGTADEMYTLLKEVGQLRMEREAARGGVSLPLPEQQIDITGDRWKLEFRTLPPADPRDVLRLRRTARALKVDWPEKADYPEFVRSLEPTKPNHAAMVVACTRLLRGSGYAGFNGEVPEQHLHSAIAAAYAHVTAPLRRLVDRYALEICVAICAGEPVPQWVLDKLEELPKTMQESGRRANQYENAVLDLVESAALAPRVGETFDAVVVEVDDKDDRRGDLTVQEPAIEARVSSTKPLPLGEQVKVTLSVADPATRKVEFTLA